MLGKGQLLNNRIGETILNSFGSKITIVEYNSALDVLVRFENGYEVSVQYSNFKIGNIKSPYERRTNNIGYIGEGRYKTKVNNKVTSQYRCWVHMIERCYSDNYHKKRQTYINCSVCEEWHNFQNFAKWFEENYYEIDGEKMSLDKDILVKGNKIYSPETCCFVPININSLFTKRQNYRGRCPIGVSFNKRDNYYFAYCSTGKGKSKTIGCYLNSEEAFIAYKNFKENLIKEVAEKYKNQIPKKLYNALINYEVEITD